MKRDMCVIRVGAIIPKDGKNLMAANERADDLCSVGRRIKFGKTAEEAVLREVPEETGVKMEIDRLGFARENCFYGNALINLGKLIYEISIFSTISSTASARDYFVASDFSEKSA